MEAETFARVLRRMLPVLQELDAETADALAALCEPNVEVGREVALALGVALLNELRKERAPGTAVRAAGAGCGASRSAIDRMGELLEEEPAHGGQAAKGSGYEPATPSRRQVANAAGISKDQQITAMRVHNVPRDSFERQVESDNPPTVTELARQGTKSKPLVPDLLKGRSRFFSNLFISASKQPHNFHGAPPSETVVRGIISNSCG